MPKSTPAFALFLGVFLWQACQARCVNVQNTSIPPSTPTSDFGILGDGTLLAPKTKLMWMRCLIGQTLSSGACIGSPTLYTWADALNMAKVQNFAGHTDWRLPNVKELLSTLEDSCYTPSLNADLFPIPLLYSAWSSTPSAVNLANEFDEAWSVDGNGFVTRISKNQSLAILLVRDAP